MTLLFLQKDLDALRARREEINQRHIAAIVAVGEAAAQGESFAAHDNAPQQMAQQDKDLYANMLRELDAMLREAQVVNPKPSDGTVQIGRTILVQDLITAEESWISVGSAWSQHDGLGTIDDPINASYRSPIARAVMGKTMNSVAEFKIGPQKKHIRVLAIK